MSDPYGTRSALKRAYHQGHRAAKDHSMKCEWHSEPFRLQWLTGFYEGTLEKHHDHKH